MKKINKIFQIGFNKCGTFSIHNFFLVNGLKSIHWGMGVLSSTIKNNYEMGYPLLKGYEDYDCFTDMEDVHNNIFIYLTHYKELDKQYPNSKFILNIRPMDKWINSRVNHPDYINFYKKITGLDKEGVIDLWKMQWQEHLHSVKEYFKNRPNDLLIFDIETESSKLPEFFSKCVEIKSSEFGHHNKTEQ